MTKRKKSPWQKPVIPTSADPGYLDSLGSSQKPSSPVTVPVESSGARGAISVRIPAGLVDRAKVYASEIGISVNSLLCVALSEYLQDRT